MSGSILVGVYQPGETLLHRLPVGAKVLGLGAFSLAVVLVRDVRASWGFLAVALGLALLARVRLGVLVRAARVVLVFAVFVAGLQWWWYGRDKAVETLVDLLALALAAVLVSATTPVNAMLDALVRWIRPLQRIGVDPDRVALTFALAIQALPGTVALALETRDAARARGLGRHPRAYLTPFVVRVVARAHETGDALHARGIGDDQLL
ncbi:energy-coupling factor transporter transmembrane protein EcfT [Nocardioides sp. cx-169]|uniref:energy-coupling factor transporter transmembrane component T family protein n=1 Tax=Nocardioides sp. cx-169 TaxID=2899080 RepID=UPI001E2932FB|nr:energy-coupling factor transporter transmembrane protein EcfT [Nocardioides sp. cx-169]MCD4535954.1 energy-coupling factor transporter transmembrane protein EcfT [Nocardioides sp. cx-169]